MRYRSQSVAYWYFAVAMVLFGLQLVFGLLSAAKYLGPDPLLYILPFDVTKVIHTNLLIVWVLTGFMGATYWMVPDESRTELYSVKLAYLQLVLWTTVVLAVLANLGVNITAMVTSLGVGGIAVALAVQNILGDLFASLAITLDKPFEVGDAIAVGNVSGTVERVGVKTTRLRAPSGEQIVMSNADLLKNAVSNYKRQETRRIVFKLAVALDTPAKLAAWVPGMLRQVIEGRDGIKFDRAHLQRIGESALEYEVVYIVQRADDLFYMDQQQDMLLQIMQRLDEAGIDFGMPRTLLEQAADDDAPSAPAAQPRGGPQQATAAQPGS